jgi:hypothetical protein
MKKKFIVLLAGLLFSAGTWAEEHPDMLLYMQPYEYTSSVKLTNYFGEYWFSQGAMVEALAKEKLTQIYTSVGMCEGNQTGKTLVWLQPRVFYNPQLNLFYGKVTANAYTGVGMLIGTYVGETKQHGFLDIKPEYWLKKTYMAAINDMVAKMQADSALQVAMSNTNPSSSADTPCSMVTLLPVQKVRDISF